MEELQADAAALREEGVRVPPRHLPAAAAAEAACPQVPILQHIVNVLSRDRSGPVNKYDQSMVNEGAPPPPLGHVIKAR